MEFKNTEVFNFGGAFRGMRNPMNSWDKSDSIFGNFTNLVGEDDLNLAQRLVRAGNEHAKFMRQIFVSVDITAPLYFWKEFDTYKVGTVANSTSTMHKLASAPITKEMFDFDKDLEDLEVMIDEGAIVFDFDYIDYIEETIGMCESLRQSYISTNDKSYWRALVQLLPSAFLQTRTITMSYANLRNIYFQRRTHKLKEWHLFCDWIATLPYANELIMLEDKNETN